MIHLTFTIPGLAVGKKEGAKLGRKRNKQGLLYNYPYIYTEPNTRRFMAEVTARAQLAVLEAGLTQNLPCDDALAMEIVAFFPRPPSAPKSQVWPAAKPVPDATNIQKAVEDALHGVIFQNDCRVVSIKTDKRYCVNGMSPQTRVEIWTAGTLRDNARPRKGE